MSEKIIKITIDQDGKAKIEAECFRGSSCKDATKIYEALYSDVISSQDKPEIHSSSGASTDQIKL